jgi:hypothetical protein
MLALYKVHASSLAKIDFLVEVLREIPKCHLILMALLFDGFG